MSELIEKWTKNVLKLNVLLVGVYYGIDIILWLRKIYLKRLKTTGINEVLFTSDQICNVCTQKTNTNCSKVYCYNYTVQKMKSFINGARRSIYICMNVFTSQDLGRTILKAHERGVSVKIIANQSTAWATGSQVKELHANGIPVKFQRTENYVHHKFCLLDTDASLKQQDVVPPTGARRIPNSGALMAGSMNWTLQAMDKNWENVIVTSDQFHVREFHQEFLRIWNHVDIVDFN